MLRILLSRCFDLDTHSMYDDHTDIGAQPEFSSIAGHVSHGLDKHAFYQHAIESQKSYFIKTHDRPCDDGKAIYVVRDGRSAIISYYHYIMNYTPGAVASLRDVVLGKCAFGSWSDHIEAWTPMERSDTLLLRYENMVQNPHRIVKAISDFIDRPVVTWNVPSFGDLQAISPNFFRRGSDRRNIEELEGEELRLFWLLHREAMIKLNYADASVTPVVQPAEAKSIC